MITGVELPLPLQDQLRGEALRAYPGECCGLIEGAVLILRQVQDEGEKTKSPALSLIPAKAGKGEAKLTDENETMRIIALHPMPNVAQQHDRFEIDPAAHIALLRNLRGIGRAIIGCYHSHPNGRAEPSERDRESAVEPDFLWLICAVEANTETASIAAFLSTNKRFSRLPIVNHPRTAAPGL